MRFGPLLDLRRGPTWRVVLAEEEDSRITGNTDPISVQRVEVGDKDDVSSCVDGCGELGLATPPWSLGTSPVPILPESPKVLSLVYCAMASLIRSSRLRPLGNR